MPFVSDPFSDPLGEADGDETGPGEHAQVRRPAEEEVGGVKMASDPFSDPVLV